MKPGFFYPFQIVKKEGKANTHFPLKPPKCLNYSNLQFTSHHSEQLKKHSRAQLEGVLIRD